MEMMMISMSEQAVIAEGATAAPALMEGCSCGECTQPTAGGQPVVTQEVKIEELGDLYEKLTRKYRMLIGGLLVSVLLLTAGLYITFGYGPALIALSAYGAFFCRNNLGMLRVARLQIKQILSAYEKAKETQEGEDAKPETVNPDGFTYI
jgi:hypothetical protein